MSLKTVIVSVGGSPSPVVFSLNKLKPKQILFFVSKNSRKEIQGIVERLEFKPQRIEIIVTVSAENLSECFEILLEKLPRYIEEWSVKPNNCWVDYTGGTKSMSSALVLATIELGGRFVYIGGKGRSKEGLGVVIDGRERMQYVTNPWRQFAVTELKKATVFFQKGLYTSAVEILKPLAEKSGEDQARFKLNLDLAEAYEAWDRFDYKQALYCFNKTRNRLELSIDKKPVRKVVSENISFLENIRKGMNEVFDLIANADRRANYESRFDDAVARIYRALEKLAQVRLAEQSIRTSDVQPEQIPDSLSQEFREKYTDQRDGRIKLPLYASFRLLKAVGVGDEMGQRYFDCEKQLLQVLDIRNNSKLAHGDKPVDRGNYQKIRDIFMRTFNFRDKDIPVFPAIEF